jgi:hypothetical protein
MLLFFDTVLQYLVSWKKMYAFIHILSVYNIYENIYVTYVCNECTNNSI